MGKVDKGLLRVALEMLVSDELIGAWAPRPLGMYAILLRTGDELRLDAKEAALWVEGARYVQAVSSVDASFQAAGGQQTVVADAEVAHARVGELEQQLAAAEERAARLQAKSDELGGALVATHWEKEHLAARAYAQVNLPALRGAVLPDSWPELLADPPPTLSPSLQQVAEGLLERAVELESLVGWQRDANHDFTVVLADGTTQFLYARDALHVALGILRASEASDLGEYWDPFDDNAAGGGDSDDDDSDNDDHAGDGEWFTLGGPDEDEDEDDDDEVTEDVEVAGGPGDEPDRPRAAR